MGFKIGDKVKIVDVSWGIKLSNKPYNTHGISGCYKTEGIIRAIGCRLPIGPGLNGEVSPTQGMFLSFDNSEPDDIMFNDLLVQTEDGYVCTATRHVKLVESRKYFVAVLGVEVEVTKEQHKTVEKGESDCNGYYYTGTLNEADVNG